MDHQIPLSSLTLLANSGNGFWYFTCFAALVLAAAVAFGVAGIRQVPIGAVGVVISMGRRTGSVKPEGWIWLVPVLSQLQRIYVRERQIDVPAAEYYTADRARISFKTTLRVVVSDPAALFDQGPGTYEPFSREGYGDTSSGAEEANVALRGLVQNSIRESVQSLNIRDVMFGGKAQNALRDRILRELNQTARRWGLAVQEVWLTDVEADDDELKRAVQSEVRESMAGRGELAAQEAEIAKGALFGKVAADLAQDVRQRLGQETSTEEIMSFLMAAYRNERALDVAMSTAQGSNDLMKMFYMQHLGVPLPEPMPMPMLPGGSAGAAREIPPHRAASGSEGVLAPEGSWIIGREGQIVLDWDGVSRHHAQLDIASGRMTLTDLGSTNGTYVSGRQLAPNVAQPVALADTVRFGKRVSHSARDLITATQTGRLSPGRETGVS